MDWAPFIVITCEVKFALYNFQLPIFELFIIHVNDFSIATSDLSLVK